MANVSFFFTGFIYGGGERVTTDVARALQASGHEVELVFLYPESYYRDLPADLPKIFLDAPRMTKGIGKLSRYLKEKQPATLMTTQEHAHLIALFARNRSKHDTRIVLRFGLPPSEMFKRLTGFRDSIMVPFLARLYFSEADAAIANSQHIRDELVKFGFEHGRIHMIPNPLPIDYSAQLQLSVDHEWFREDTPIIMGLGRLEFQKDFQTLLRAFAQMVQDVPARLMILGTGSEHESLLSLAARLGVGDKVYIPGEHIRNPLSYMKHADVFVLSSIYEGFPNVLTEAMAAGCAVVSTDCVSGPREIVAPNSEYKNHIEEKLEWAEYGVLVPTESVLLLADVLKKLLLDPEKLNLYKQKSVERAVHFDIAHILPKYQTALGLG